MVVAFYFRLHLAYFPRPVVAIFARPEQPYYILLFPFLLKYVLIIQCSSLNNSYYRKR